MRERTPSRYSSARATAPSRPTLSTRPVLSRLRWLRATSTAMASWILRLPTRTDPLLPAGPARSRYCWGTVTVTLRNQRYLNTNCDGDTHAIVQLAFAATEVPQLFV